MTTLSLTWDCIIFLAQPLSVCSLCSPFASISKHICVKSFCVICAPPKYDPRHNILKVGYWFSSTVWSMQFVMVPFCTMSHVALAQHIRLHSKKGPQNFLNIVKTCPLQTLAWHYCVGRMHAKRLFIHHQVIWKEKTNLPCLWWSSGR